MPVNFDHPTLWLGFEHGNDNYLGCPDRGLGWTAQVLIAYLVGAALATSVVAAFVTNTSLWAAVTVVLAVVWSFVNRPIEGPVIWHLPYEHGVTVSDILALMCFVLGLSMLRRARRAVSR